MLGDGPGLAGGGAGPTSTVLLTVDDEAPAPPRTRGRWSSWSRDVRPPDYATSFARQALQLSGLAWPIAVCARWRPPWLEAVAAEPGVLDMSLDDAVAFYRDL